MVETGDSADAITQEICVYPVFIIIYTELG